MVEEVAATFFVKIGGWVVAPIGDRFHYLTHCKRNVEVLKRHLPNLDDKRDGVQRAVDAATRKGEEIKRDVQRWQTNVEEIMAETEKFVGKIVANKRCLKWWYPNLRLRYKLSMEARRISYIVTGLQGGGIAENTHPPCIDVMRPVVPASVETLSVSLPAPPPGIEFMSSKDFVVLKSTKSTLDQIFEALKDESCNMIGLYGMGGVGKTTLVKEVSKKVKDEKLFDQVVMAVVSQKPIIRDIQGQIADTLGLTLSEESDSGRAGRLYERLKNEKRVLIILDNIWGRLDLEAVGIPHDVEHEGCKIILTTREETVCTAMEIRTKKIPIKVLSNEESWDLFQMHVGVDIESTPLNVPAKAVVGECKGLPIALVTVGRALRDKDLEEWNAAVNQLKKSRGENIVGMDKDVFSCIKLSYDYLRNEEAEMCFLLCCLFPEDYNIPIECLARYAKGKGLIKDVRTMEEARSRAQSIIKNLKSSCMLLDSDKEGYVKMHDIVRDAAISIASGGTHDLFLVKAGAGLKEWPEQETFESYTGISLMTNDLQELPGGLNCPNTQILLLGENEGFAAISDVFFEGMGMLKVLDLSRKPYARESILSLPPSLKFLTNLRALNLDGCNLGNISVLLIPEKLEILSFCGSDISALPEEIGKLINLRVLDLTHCRLLKRIPSNVISQLTRLEELYTGDSFKEWEVEGTSEERRSASLSEVKLLPRLTILCIDVNEAACFPDKFLLPNLLKFHLRVGSCSHTCYYPKSRSLTLQDSREFQRVGSCSYKCYYPKSRSLTLGGIQSPLPDIVRTQLLKTVEELSLRDSYGMCNNILLGIDEGELNGLKSLELERCDWIESLIKTNQWKPVILLPNLEKLCLRSLKNMEVMCHGLIPSGSLEKLRVLRIEWCQELKVILPANLVHRLNLLEEVTVRNCENLQQIFQLNECGAKEEDANMVFSSLRELKLYWLPELLSIWNGIGSFVSLLCNLTELEILNCDKLSNIFSSRSLAQSLLNLESLKIEHCDNVETIVAEDQEGTVVSNSNNCIQPVIFPKLQLIEVRYCRKLTSLFTIATARSLVKLKEVSLFHNGQLLEIVSHGRKREEEEEGDEKEILLPQLNLLKLHSMRRLERLCPESFNMHLPSLKELVVGGCPMMNNIAADATAYGLKSAPNLEKVEVEKQTLNGAAIQNLFSKQLIQADPCLIQDDPCLIQDPSTNSSKSQEPFFSFHCCR